MLNSKLFMSHSALRQALEWISQAMIALLALCLLLPLSGCTTTRTVYVTVPPVPLPASLTAETAYPEIPESMTWGESLDLNVSLLAVLGTGQALSVIIPVSQVRHIKRCSP